MAATDRHPALMNMKAHLDTKREDWGIRAVDDWPSWIEGKGGPRISLSISNFTPQMVGGAYPTLVIDKKWAIDITYWSEGLRPQVHYHDVLVMLENIIDFLLTDSTPNDYGELLIDEQAFGPQVGNLPTNDPSQQLFGGTVTVVLTKTGVEVTQT
jgi:hypothetical protein